MEDWNQTKHVFLNKNKIFFMEETKSKIHIEIIQRQYKLYYKVEQKLRAYCAKKN